MQEGVPLTEPKAHLPHYCHARRLTGCAAEVPPKMFMCKRHWFMLPKRMRDAIWAAYQPGQEDRLVRPTEEYFRVTDEAEVYVAEREAVRLARPPSDESAWKTIRAMQEADRK